MKNAAFADVIGITMMAVVGSLPLGCVPRVDAKVDLQPIVAVCGEYSIMVSGGRSVVVPTDGCSKGCKCAGSGVEPTGDGLERVPCRCPDTCKCKTPKKEAVPCQSGTCRPPMQRIVR